MSENTSVPGTPPFAFINETSENEPRRAIAALQDTRNGWISQPHLYTQLWRIQRCFGVNKTELTFNFIGHMDTIEEDWRFIQLKLNVSQKALLRNWASLYGKLNGRNARDEIKTAIQFDRVTSYDSPWSLLTKHVCDYYKPDFDCFGFDTTLCETWLTMLMLMIQIIWCGRFRTQKDYIPHTITTLKTNIPLFLVTTRNDPFIHGPSIVVCIVVLIIMW